jgi:chromosome segregation ATPase
VELRKELSIIRIDNEDLARRLNSKETDFEELKQRNQEQQRILQEVSNVPDNDAEVDLETTRKEHVRLEKSMELSKAENEHIIAMNDAIRAECDELSKKLSEMTKQVINVRTETEELRLTKEQELESIRIEHEKQIANQRTELESFRSAQQKKIEEMIQEREAFRQRIDLQNEEIERLKAIATSNFDSPPSSARSRKSMMERMSDSAEESRRRNVIISPSSSRSSRRQISFFKRELRVSMANYGPDFSHHTDLRFSFPIDTEVFPEHVYLRISEPSIGPDCPKPVLELVTPDPAYFRPDEAEQALFKAQQDSLLNEVSRLQGESVANARTYEQAKTEMRHNKQSMVKMKTTIAGLEEQLKTERNGFKEQLNRYWHAAEDRISEFKQEAGGLESLRTSFAAHPGMEIDNELDGWSKRLQKVMGDNARLQNQLEEVSASNHIWESRHAKDIEKMETLKAQNLELEKQLNESSKHQSLVEHAGKLKARLSELQVKYNELETQYHELARTKVTRFDPLMLQRSPVRRDSARGEGEAHLAARLKQNEARMEVLRGRNEEMQALLGKSNATNQRLNQLLSRKEVQLTHLQEQIAILKQELILQQSK